MPSLGFLEAHHESSRRPPITERGYNSDFFSKIDSLFDDLGKADPGVDLNDRDQIKSTLFRTGPCPGLSRVYHQFVSTPEFSTADEEIDSILGREVDLTRREAGMKFEAWVDEANRAFNEWVASGDDDVFENLDSPRPLQEFYKRRSQEALALAEDSDIDLDDLKIDVQRSVSSPFFHEAEPDGAWLPDSLPGAIFESKLSVPGSPIDRHLLAGYAVHLERAEEVQIDYGIYLGLSDDLSKLVINKIHADDVIREKTKENLEKFSTLAFESMAEGTWDDSLHIKDRLTEPMEPKYAGACRTCPYTRACHDEGRYFELKEEIENEISNLKLSGNQLLDVLQSAARAETSDRNNVAREVMNHFPGKSLKSVFRGMVIPTMKRLHLYRVQNDGRTILVSPNGQYILNPDSADLRYERLKRCLRDYFACELGITEDALRYYEDHGDRLDSSQNFLDNLNRTINQYIDYFGIHLPESDDSPGSLLDYMYQSEDTEQYFVDPEARRQLIQETMPLDKRIQIDFARRKLLKELDERNEPASSWVVDELLLREWRSEGRVIDLMEGSTMSKTRLKRGGRMYDAIQLMYPMEDEE